MAAFFEWKQEALILIGEARSLAEELGCPSLAESIGRQAEGLQQKELTVVAAGEARRGKSMLLNALLGETEPLFPVGADVCTNVPLVVRYGEKERILAWVKDEESRDGRLAEQITRGQIAEYASERGNPENHKNVVLLEAAVPNAFLEEGVAFVDTPGAGSYHAGYAEAARRFLPKADLLLFVSDAEAGLTETELELLKTGYRCCQNILFPLTKKDVNAQYLEIVKDNRAKISRALGIPEEEARIVPVSGSLKLKGMERGREAMCESSNFRALEREIRENIARNRARICLFPFLSGVREGLGQALEHTASLRRADKRKEAEALRAWKDGERRLEKQREEGARWRARLADSCGQAIARAGGESARLRDMAEELLRERCGELGAAIRKKRPYRALIGELEEKIGGEVRKIKARLIEELQLAARRMEEEADVSLSVDGSALDAAEFCMDAPISEPLAGKAAGNFKNGGWKVGAWLCGVVLGGFAGAFLGSLTSLAAGGLSSLAAGGSFGLALGGAKASWGFLGGFAGAVLGGLLGFAAGGARGGAKGFAGAHGGYGARGAAAAKDALLSYAAERIGDWEEAVRRAGEAVLQELREELDRELEAKESTLRAQVGKLAENARLAGAQDPEREASLEAGERRARELIGRIGALEKEMAEAEEGARELIGALEKEIAEAGGEDASGA